MLAPSSVRNVFKIYINLIPLVLKYTYTLPDSACIQVHLYSTWFRLYSSTPILYLILLILKYTYTLPDFACTQVHLYSTWFSLYSSTPILYLIPLVLKYTCTLPYSACTQVHLYSTFFRLYYNLSLLTPQSTIIRQAIWTSQHTRSSESVGCTEWPVAGRHSLGLSLTNVLSASFFLRIKVDCDYYYYWL